MLNLKKIKSLLILVINALNLSGYNSIFWNLLILSPVILGSFSDLARAGDFSSLPIHYAIAIVAVVIFSASLQLSISIGMVLVYVYMILVGLLRRSLIPSTGYLSNDPITLVSTFVSLSFFIRMLLQRKIPRYTQISRTMIFFVSWMFIEVFNPLQGGILVGFSGIIFYVVPIMWYYIGLTKGNAITLSILFVIAVVMSLIESLIGIYQTRNGLNEVEAYWVRIAGGGSQVVAGAGGVNRSFGTFLSFSEYVFTLVAGCCISWALFLKKKYVYLVPFIFLFLLLFLSSSRTGIIAVLFSVALGWAFQGTSIKIWLPRLVFAIVLGIWGLSFGLGAAKEINVDNRTEVLLNHEISGLSDPFAQQSTSHAHISLITKGILSGFKVPIGSGLGSTTIAAKKFSSGTDNTGSAENDYANMFQSLGAFGGILYIVICVQVWIAIVQYWYKTRDSKALVVLMLMAGYQGQWLAGAHYAQTILFWFCIGTMDRIIFVHNMKNIK